MPARRASKKELAVLRRRQQMADLYLKGWSQHDIALHLDLAQSTVSDDLQFIRQLWRDSAIRDFDEARAIELQKIDQLERVAWEAWNRSTKPAQSAVVTGEGPGQQARRHLKHQNGDPRFLQIVASCIQQRRALLGLDVLPQAPVPEGFDGAITLEARHERVFTFLAVLRDRERAAAAGAGPDAAQPGVLRNGSQPGALEDGGTPGPAE